MDPVVHFEVPTDDSERAQAFYKQAFGWEFTPNPELNYTLITTSPAGEDMRPGPGTINGGCAGGWWHRGDARDVGWRLRSIRAFS